MKMKLIYITFSLFIFFLAAESTIFLVCLWEYKNPPAATQTTGGFLFT